MWWKQKTPVEKVVDQGKRLEPEIREMVIGRKTVVSLLSFGVGTVLIGNFIWKLVSDALGIWIAAAIGLVMFLVGGVIRREFRK